MTHGTYATRREAIMAEICACGHICGIHDPNGKCKAAHCGCLAIRFPVEECLPSGRSKEYYLAMRSMDVG